MQIRHFSVAVAAKASRHALLFGRALEGQTGTGIPLPQHGLAPAQVASAAARPSSFERQPASVACGHYSSCIVTADGGAYVTGQNKQGELGLGRQNRDVNIFTPVTHAAAGLAEMTRTQLAATAATAPTAELLQPVAACSMPQHHSALITATGKLFTFGCGRDGQLGHGGHLGPQGSYHGGSQADVCWQPSQVAYPFAATGETVIQTALSRFFTLMLTNQGRVYCAGSSFDRALGIGDHAYTMVPQHVHQGLPSPHGPAFTTAALRHCPSTSASPTSSAAGSSSTAADDDGDAPLSSGRTRMPRPGHTILSSKSFHPPRHPPSIPDPSPAAADASSAAADSAPSADHHAQWEHDVEAGRAVIEAGGDPVVSIAAGLTFSLAITASGRLFFWGRIGHGGSSGQVDRQLQRLGQEIIGRNAGPAPGLTGGADAGYDDAGEANGGPVPPLPVHATIPGRLQGDTSSISALLAGKSADGSTPSSASAPDPNQRLNSVHDRNNISGGSGGRTSSPEVSLNSLYAPWPIQLPLDVLFQPGEDDNHDFVGVGGSDGDDMASGAAEATNSIGAHENITGSVAADISRYFASEHSTGHMHAPIRLQLAAGLHHAAIVAEYRIPIRATMQMIKPHGVGPQKAATDSAAAAADGAPTRTRTVCRLWTLGVSRYGCLGNGLDDATRVITTPQEVNLKPLHRLIGNVNGPDGEACDENVGAGVNRADFGVGQRAGGKQDHSGVSGSTTVADDLSDLARIYNGEEMKNPAIQVTCGPYNTGIVLHGAPFICGRLDSPFLLGADGAALGDEVSLKGTAVYEAGGNAKQLQKKLRMLLQLGLISDTSIPSTWTAAPRMDGVDNDDDDVDGDGEHRRTRGGGGTKRPPGSGRRRRASATAVSDNNDADGRSSGVAGRQTLESAQSPSTTPPPPSPAADLTSPATAAGAVAETAPLTRLQLLKHFVKSNLSVSTSGTGPASGNGASIHLHSNSSSGGGGGAGQPVAAYGHSQHLYAARLVPILDPWLQEEPRPGRSPAYTSCGSVSHVESFSLGAAHGGMVVRRISA